MATLGSAIITRVFGHSQAEKVFRPWWDNLEDFLLYGLVMLGLVVAPTSMITGSPLECTFCKGDLCRELNDTGTLPDPGYYSVWIKKICTFNGSVDSFTLYFPYILLLIALSLVFIEKVFLALFQANNKLDKFYKLLAENNIVEEGNNKMKVEPQSIETVQVEESFKSCEDNYFVCYLVRTVLELVISTCLLTWMTCYAMPPCHQIQTSFLARLINICMHALVIHNNSTNTSSALLSFSSSCTSSPTSTTSSGLSTQTTAGSTLF